MHIKEYTVQRWTQSAVDCFNRGCVCSGCPTYELIGKRCQMKNSVRLLVRKFGNPPKANKGIFPGMTLAEYQITEAILKGAASLEEIAAETGIKKRTVNGYMSDLYLLSELDGYKFRNGSRKLEEFVEYVQNNYGTKNNEKGENNMNDQDLNLEYPNYLEALVNALKKGYKEYGEIENITNIRRGTLSVYFDDLFKHLAKLNLVSTNKKQSRRLSVIEFVQSRLCDEYQKEKTTADDLDLKIKMNQFGIGEPRKVEIKTYDEIIKEKKTKKEEPKLNLTKRIKEHKEQQKESSLLNEPYTTTEIKVVALLKQGYNYKKIAEEMCVSPTTIKAHITNIFSKRDYHSLQDLIVAEYKQEVSALETYIKEHTNVAVAAEPKLDLEPIRLKIRTEINKLNDKLKALDLLEEELRGI